MSEKWTPGPWFTRNIGEKENLYVVGVAWLYGDPDSRSVSNPEPWETSDGEERYYYEAVCFVEEGTLSDGYQYANAHLIAAAPEMAEALKNLLTALAMGPLEVAAIYGPDAHPDEPVIDAARVAQAALAKARGEP